MKITLLVYFFGFTRDDEVLRVRKLRKSPREILALKRRVLITSRCDPRYFVANGGSPEREDRRVTLRDRRDKRSVSGVCVCVTELAGFFPGASEHSSC